MAKIQTETVVLTFNRLVKESDTPQSIVSAETSAALEQVAQELAGAGVIVEVDIVK